MPNSETNRHDRHTIEVYRQHCGNYLTTLVGIEHNRLSAVRAHLGELAQQHATEVRF
jgi:hypothetical protein